MKNWTNNTDFLREIPLPTLTTTYKPVPHTVFLDEIKEELYKYIIENENNIMNPAIYFTNSYNKMRRAELQGGISILVCKNGAIGIDTASRFSRKHSGTVLEDLRTNIVLTVDSLEEQFNRLKHNMEEMQQIIKGIRRPSLLPLLSLKCAITGSIMASINRALNTTKVSALINPRIVILGIRLLSWSSPTG